MNPQKLEELAKQLIEGRLSMADFVRQTVTPETADLGDTQVDLDRARRCGLPEVIYAEGKSAATLVKITSRLLQEGHAVLATRVSPAQADVLLRELPEAEFNSVGRTVRVPAVQAAETADPPSSGCVVIVTAGTSDLAVAEEARETAEWAGARVTLVQDVGVAGPQRLLAQLPTLRQADAIVVVAGMEGALPSVVGGHVACPVIAVPTSVGYGASFGGLAALLGMLNSCSANVSVVNIDAGFKAGYVAALIARRCGSTNGVSSDERTLS